MYDIVCNELTEKYYIVFSKCLFDHFVIQGKSTQSENIQSILDYLCSVPNVSLFLSCLYYIISTKNIYMYKN